MPHEALRLGGVIINVDVGLTDADTTEADLNGSSHYGETLGTVCAAEVKGGAVSVRTGAATFLSQVPFWGAVGTGDDERETTYFTHSIGHVHCGLVHILQTAGGSEASELGLLKPFTCNLGHKAGICILLFSNRFFCDGRIGLYDILQGLYKVRGTEIISYFHYHGDLII